MAMTGAQMLYKCCGLYCSFLACVGVYFFSVLAFWQSQGARYLVWDMERLNELYGEDSNNFKVSFIICIFVSQSSNHHRLVYD